MTTEHEFQIGEWAWSPFDGWDKISKNGDYEHEYAIQHSKCAFTKRGYSYEKHMHPTLFTADQAAKLGYFPPKEKKKVELQLWTNVYPHGKFALYESEQDANSASGTSRIACVELTGSYEIEE